MTQKTSSPADERPLSPHVTIYRPQITSVMSILHRITGMALALGTIALVGWLWSAAYSVECFAAIHTLFTGITGTLLLMAWSYAFFYHLCNGVRHLFWDLGMGFEVAAVHRSGVNVFIISVALTIAVWVVVFEQYGVPI
jgi:succinate dehydrogenase / fumarate reductase, cytochrome b subunit